MQAGKLRHRVTLYDVVQTQDMTTGAVSEGWGNARDRYASVDMVSARERLAGQGPVDEGVFKIILRHDPTFTETSKVMHDGVNYYPVQVRHVDLRQRMLEVLAVRRLPS